MTKQKRYYVFALSILLPAAFIACSGKKKADVAQTAARAEHNPAQCPKLSQIKGDFLMDNPSGFLSKTINIGDEPNLRLLYITFDGDEQLVINGKPQQLDNGANLSAACINDTIHVTGTGPTPDNAFTDYRIKVSSDGKTLTVDEAQPSKQTYQYSRTAKAVAAPTEKLKKFFDKLTGQDKKSGMPAPEDKKNREP